MQAGEMAQQLKAPVLFLQGTRAWSPAFPLGGSQPPIISVQGCGRAGEPLSSVGTCTLVHLHIGADK